MGSSVTLLSLISLMVLACGAQSSELLQDAQASKGRQLLQGVRPFSKVTAHKTPKAPSSPKRKTYERTFPGSAPKRALLEYPVTEELAVEGGRQLLQGVRPFSQVTAHKTPKAPSSPKRKTYERDFPGSAPKRALLEYPVTDKLAVEGGRQLLQGVRPFSGVTAHKTPKAPSSPKRKTYETNFPGSAPKRALLEYPVTDELAVEGGRQLLQGVRPFSKVTAHKTPKSPSSPKRKTYDMKFPDSAPKRALLEYPVTDELAVEGGRQLLQGVRPFSKVTAHKTPQASKLSRKNFERKSP